jgi:uncharacterized protein involved in response to NO
VSLTGHPLWLAGFRPFFALACLAGLSLPPLWVGLHLGLIDAPSLARAPMLWHGHEMFFGFGWAVLGGFLLTATKNWVSIRGYHGPLLAFLAAAWVVERAGMWFGGTWPPALFELSNKLFLGSIVAMLLWTLIRYRHQDSYRDNYFFLLILPAFLVAKQLMLDGGHFRDGATMATGLFRVAFLMMLERTLTQFMKNVFQVDILRHAALDRRRSSCSVWCCSAVLASCRRRRPPGCRCCWRCYWPAGFSSGSRSSRCAGSTSASCILVMPPSCCNCCSSSSAGSPHRRGSAPCRPMSSASASWA